MKNTKCYRRISLVVLLVAVASLRPFAQDMQITVCATGCDFTNTQLQTAINSATTGAEILLQEGFTYVGQFTLPRHNGTSMVTLRTGVTSTGTVRAAGTFPSAGVRVTPAIATSSNFAKLQSGATHQPALRTVITTTNPARYWTVKWVEGLWNSTTGQYHGSGPIFQVGDDSGNNQPNEAAIPNNFIFEQIYLHGHPIKGQYRGFSVHASDFILRHSEISEIKSMTEGQALWLNS
jgi:hypothetical protein